MNFTWQKILGIGITAFLIMTLIFATGTGMVDKISGAHTKAVERVDSTVESYDE